MKQATPWHAFLAVVVLMLSARAHAQDELLTIQLEEYGVEFRLPASFEPDEDYLITDKTVSHAYIGDASGDGFYDTEIYVRPLGDPLQQVLITRAMLGENRDHVSLLRWHWDGMVINGSRVIEFIDGEVYVTYNIMVPALPQAIVIGVAGLPETEESLELQARAILPTLKATTNWVKPGSRAPAPDNRRLKLTIVLAVAASGVLLSGLVYSLSWRRLPRGRFLLLAVIAWCAGAGNVAALAKGNGLWQGCARLTITFVGFTWLVFGIWDLFRRRPRKSDNPSDCLITEHVHD